ncbi:hypothetical protein K2X30_06710 [bacterium]|jgi:uncharacterized protein with PIN domain|nr:hypothetical protein [bacterium]
MDENNDLPQEEMTELNEVLGQFFGSAQEVVERYTHCLLCGAHLHFSHITDFHRNITHETSRCPECGVKVRKFIHKLQ